MYFVFYKNVIYIFLFLQGLSRESSTVEAAKLLFFFKVLIEIANSIKIVFYFFYLRSIVPLTVR